jgi:hypothetical protein
VLTFCFNFKPFDKHLVQIFLNILHVNSEKNSFTQNIIYGTYDGSGCVVLCV